MTTLEIIQASQIKAAAVKAVAKLLQEKYPELLKDEPEIEKFVKLLEDVNRLPTPPQSHSDLPLLL